MTPETQPFVASDALSKLLPPTAMGQDQAAVEKENSETPEQRKKRFRRNRDYSPQAGYDNLNWGADNHDTWLQEKKHWTETPLGKSGIEFVSRITLGAMFYAWVGQSESMRRVSGTYDPATYKRETAKPLEKVAYAVDKTLGVALKRTTMLFNGGDEQKAEQYLRFRQERFPNKKGRSYGAEYVSVLSDFAGMTVGTGIAREGLTSVLNPTERKAWLKDGKFDAAHFAQRLGSKLWELVSYNLGEDIVTTAHYVFFLRGCRNLINRYVARGFNVISDHADNSGGLLVKGDGTIKSEYQGAGMLDLILRFTGYNIGTQMYRDGYHQVGTALKEWKQNDFRLGTPEWLKNPAEIPGNVVQKASGLGRYALISSIRSMLQMFVASPFFAIVRTPLSKPNGLIVNPAYGFLQMEVDDKENQGQKKWITVRRGGGRDGQDYAEYYEHGKAPDLRWSRELEMKNELEAYDAAFVQGKTKEKRPIPKITRNPVGDFSDGKFDVYGSAQDERRALFYDSTTRLTDAIGSNLEKVANHSFWEKTQNWFWKLTGNGHRSKQMSREATLAGMPYAIYFAAKVFTRENYVNAQMNLAIGRMLDGIMAFDWHEIREGISEIQRTMMGLPFKEPNRQAELIYNHLHNPSDKSPIPENWSKEQQKEFVAQHAQNKAPDPTDRTADISYARSDYYRGRAKNKHEQQKNAAKYAPAASKEDSVKRSRTQEAGAEQLSGILV